MSEENVKPKQRFGRYLILDHLVDGGMAKICRARFLGEQADKIVAIKMVQPQYSQDESFKSMFMDEVKVTFGLQHPNIVQTYDYGYFKNQLFVAMEYCDGRNLKEYLDKLKQKGFIFPIEISVYIISQACQGLFYAHTLTDKLTGKEYNIVHRDISPHNIMLTYDGSIKVIDFGIAKAETNSEATQAGTIKGKLSYLAPEYLDGHQLDPSYDQFALGITLWEMLCSRKLFKAANDLAVLKKIQECKIPAPSSINPIVPKELDEIVLKSLHKDRKKRYSDLNQMNKDLTKFLYTYKPEFNATDLSYFAKELFKDEIKKDRERLFEFGKIDIRPYLDEMKKEQQGGGGVEQSNSEEVRESAPQSAKVFDFGFEGEKEANRPKGILKNKEEDSGPPNNKTKASTSTDEEMSLEINSTAPKKRTSSTSTHSNSSTATTRTSLTNSKGQRAKTSTKTGVRNKTRTRSRRLPKKKESSMKSFAVVAGFLLAAVFFGKDTIMDKFNEYLGNSAPEQKTVSQDNLNSQKERNISSKEGTLRLTGIDKRRQRVFIDEKERKVSFMEEVNPLPTDREMTLRIQTPGREHYVTNIYIPSDNPSKTINVPEMPQAGFGYLINSRHCLVGTLEFTLYGENRTKKLPLEQGSGIAFPVDRDNQGNTIPKEHSVIHKRANGIAKRLDFRVDHEDDIVDLCEL